MCDELVIVHPLYLTQNLFSSVENIHRYIGVCSHEVCLARFSPAYMYETPGAKMPTKMHPFRHRI